MQPVRVLFFVDRLLHGGIQQFIVDYLSNMDRNRVCVDILTMDDGNRYPLEETIRQMGVDVYRLEGVWIRKPQDFIRQARALDAFFAAHHDYTAVHLHSSSKNFNVLRKARRYGIPVRIAHSHNNQFQSTSKAQIFLGELLRSPLKRAATHYFACSELAGEWLFGKEILKKETFSVIPNAIDIDHFLFDAEKREAIRGELGVADKLVIGNVGRFAQQKNHTFLLRVFEEIYKRRPDSCLVLVGDGDLRGPMEHAAEQAGLGEQVRFLGYRTDPNLLLNAFDVFVCPSLFEGFGIVLVEAQANGLPCFASKDVISPRARATNLLAFLSLDRPPEEWAEAILGADLRRRDYTSQIRGAGFDIRVAAKKLESFYVELQGNRAAVMPKMSLSG